MITTTDIVYHLTESIEPWVDRDNNNQYWSYDRVLEDDTLLFSIKSEDNEVLQSFYIHVTEK